MKHAEAGPKKPPRRKRSEEIVKRGSPLGKTSAPIINHFQALILEAFEIKLSWDDMSDDGKLAELRSSLMHWAGITDRDWETVSRDAKATFYKPKDDEEISDKSFTRKATMSVNVTTETLVKTLMRNEDDSSFLQVGTRFTT